MTRAGHTSQYHVPMAHCGLHPYTMVALKIARSALDLVHWLHAARWLLAGGPGLRRAAGQQGNSCCAICQARAAAATDAGLVMAPPHTGGAAQHASWHCCLWRPPVLPYTLASTGAHTPKAEGFRRNGAKWSDLAFGLQLRPLGLENEVTE